MMAHPTHENARRALWLMYISACIKILCIYSNNINSSVCVCCFHAQSVAVVRYIMHKSRTLAIPHVHTHVSSALQWTEQQTDNSPVIHFRILVAHGISLCVFAILNIYQRERENWVWIIGLCVPRIINYSSWCICPVLRWVATLELYLYGYLLLAHEYNQFKEQSVLLKVCRNTSPPLEYVRGAQPPEFGGRELGFQFGLLQSFKCTIIHEYNLVCVLCGSFRLKCSNSFVLRYVVKLQILCGVYAGVWCFTVYLNLMRWFERSAYKTPN